MGRRWRAGLLRAVAVAVVLAAVGASGPAASGGQARTVADDAGAPASTGDGTAGGIGDLPLDGGGPRLTDRPGIGLPVPGVPTGASGLVTPVVGGASVPATVLAAYRNAQASIALSDPGCHLPWELLAGIGRVESGHARGGLVDVSGTTYTPILGPVLDGNGFAAIGDTDGGVYDGDARWDRAVGPMQFIPSTWRLWGADGNGDGLRNPNNVHDAALASGHYLCAGNRDLADPAQLDRAILSYNHSQEYLRTVRSWMVQYGSGVVGTPDVPPYLPVWPDPAPTSAPTSAPSPSPSPSPSQSVTPSPGPSTPAPSASPSPTASSSPTAGASPSPTVSPSGTPTACPTVPGAGPSPSGSPSGSPSPSASPSPEPSPSASASPSATPTGTDADGCPAPSPSPSATPSATASAAQSSPSPSPSA